MTLPIDRIVAFLTPYIAVLSGAVADWLFVHIHFLGDFRDRNQVVMGITQFVVWGLTAVLVWAGSSNWLNRAHITLPAQDIQPQDTQ